LNLRGIAKAYLGVLTILGLLMILVPLVDVIYGESISVWFLVAGEALVFIGLLASKIKAPPLTTIEALLVAALCWISVSLIGAAVLTLQTGLPFIDTLFESVSGFTGTGFTVFVLTGMKHSIIFWRCLMQWAGELGFVVFAMVLIPYFYGVAKNLYGVERPVKIEASFYRTAAQLLVIYVVLTLIGTVTYVASGMSFFDAVCHMMTTIATGGMSTYDDGYFHIFVKAPLTYVPVFIFMVLGGMNLYDLYNLTTGRFKALLKSEELRCYIASLLIISSMVFVSYVFVDKVHNVWQALMASFFNNVSGMTTTGFSIGSIAQLSDTTKTIITVGMVIGGMSFSTAGGIKSFRLLLVLKKFKNMVESLIAPSAIVRPIAVGGRVVSENDISHAMLFIIIHIATVTTGAILISAQGYTITDSLFEAASAASCVGLSVGIVAPTAPAGVKLTIITLMILGRLEYLHLIFLASLIFGKKILMLSRPQAVT